MGSINLWPLFFGVDGKAYGVDGVDAWKHGNAGIFFSHLTIFVIILYTSSSQPFVLRTPNIKIETCEVFNSNYCSNLH